MKNDDISRLCYIGPTFRGGFLKYGTTFKGGLPKHVQDRIAEVPALSGLFIEVGANGSKTALGRAQAQRRIPTSTIAAFYEAVETWIKEDALKRNATRARHIEQMEGAV